MLEAGFLRKNEDDDERRSEIDSESRERKRYMDSRWKGERELKGLNYDATRLTWSGGANGSKIWREFEAYTWMLDEL
ncbi:hypothetical protein RYX36_031167 [Vicia faba]